MAKARVHWTHLIWSCLQAKGQTTTSDPRLATCPECLFHIRMLGGSAEIIRKYGLKCPYCDQPVPGPGFGTCGSSRCQEAAYKVPRKGV